MKMRRKQDTVRCFPCKCRRCGQTVLYWEGSRGSKVFFNYPVGEKLIKHYCRLPSKDEKRFVKKSWEEHSVIDPNRASYQCPVCGKIFKTTNDMSAHVKQLKRQDDKHADFFDNALQLMAQEGLPDKSLLEKLEMFNSTDRFKPNTHIIIKDRRMKKDPKKEL